MTRENFDAFILAGGRSRRMGANKLFLQIDGLSMVESAIATCEQCFGRVKLVAGKADTLSSFARPTIIDSPIAKGPMAGVIAALENCIANHCFITAADFPDLNPEIIELIIAQYHGQQYLGLIEANNIQPLCGIYHKSSLDVFYRYAQANDFRMTEAVKALDYSGIALPNRRWRNINRPEDLPRGVIDD